MPESKMSTSHQQKRSCLSPGQHPSLCQFNVTAQNKEILNHLPYSLDLAPSDYHLFMSLQIHLNNKIF
ncbi:hypothetical protein L798_07827 [Zootermopsis nevadensis]|uniref:Uncharacterized protein n=1 Tax=Zootermopsis nevadensis TaxID=136037 RepID=A0A067RC46_ZOONE|nr:hypothetical protein L798_07827 [Zootermopsis nevadensis]